ncbi:hypothetical protein BDA99DRAFT_507671 [Phascolomyces articulosus]|uniref:Uncharacterized protein n=1 Tax=Phascolomyces articulosus TaxID=60185 RepID=A0AAD5KBW1_9FUNG|nr:hypothetical protein BDA99DRAFT_507671 [Phascolomyces articulosus]
MFFILASFSYYYYTHHISLDKVGNFLCRFIHPVFLCSIFIFPFLLYLFKIIYYNVHIKFYI